jgi:LysM repeat protein
MQKLIDVSTWNENINYNTAKASGISGVIIRAGFGSSTVDNEFVNHITGAIKAGLHIGIYWFSYAYTTSAARQEAEFCNSVISKYKDKIDLGVYFDWEYDSMNYARNNGVYPDRNLITQMNVEFCKRITELGYKAGYYLNLDYSRNYIDESKLKGYLRWFAYYGEQQNDCYIQQYTSTGRVNGVNGNVDMNWLIGEVKPMPAPQPSPKPTPQPAGAHTYTVKPGDTLSGIAAMYGTTYQKIAADNGISNPNLIYPGQVLKINTGGSTSPSGGSSSGSKKYYSVVSGDTLSGIAARYDTTVAQLVAWNNIPNPDLIYPGQKIRVR